MKEEDKPMSTETDKAFQDGFTKGFLSCKAETDKALREVLSKVAGLAAGVQFANPTITVDGSGLGRSFSKEIEKNREALLDAVHGFPTPPNSFTINHRFTADDEVIKEVATKVFIDGLGRIVQAIDEAEKTPAPIITEAQAQEVAERLLEKHRPDDLPAP